jgi:iron(III) transport system ATP-binding protein
MPAPMLAITNLSKCFGLTPVLSNFSLQIAAESVTALTGPVGAGKTTLLRLVAGLDMADAGEIRWNGQLWSSPDTQIPPWRRPLSMVFQQPTLWPHLSVAGQLEIVLRSDHVALHERRRRTMGMLQELSIGSLAHRYPSELSGGQQQGVAVARALVREPQILLLDEPFSQMDRLTRDTAWRLIQTRRSSTRATILLVTHDTAWAARSCEAVLELPQIRSIGDRAKQ